jgi:hypothetical protein
MRSPSSRAMLLVVLLPMGGCSSGPSCPPRFKRFTHPSVSLCYPETWQRLSIPERSANSRAPWLVLVLQAPGGGMFSVDVLPVSPTDFPLTMLNREDAIDRYAYANGIVARLIEDRALRKEGTAAMTVEMLNGKWRVRHRIFQGSMGGPSTYDFGKIYESRTPMTIGLTTGLVGDHVVLFTQYAPAAISEASHRMLVAFATIRETVRFTERVPLDGR